MQPRLSDDQSQPFASLLPRVLQTRQRCIRAVGGRTPTADNVPAASHRISNDQIACDLSWNMADGFFTYWLPGSSQSVTSYTLRYQQEVISSTTSFGFDRAGCMKMAPKHSYKWFKKRNPFKSDIGLQYSMRLCVKPSRGHDDHHPT